MIRTLALYMAALLTFGSPCNANTNIVRAGEHLDFTRVTIEVEAGTEFSVNQNGKTFNIDFSTESLSFDTSLVFRRIGRDRIADVISTNGQISFVLTCKCLYRTFVQADSLIVIDFFEGVVAPDEDTREIEFRSQLNRHYLFGTNVAQVKAITLPEEAVSHNLSLPQTYNGENSVYARRYLGLNPNIIQDGIDTEYKAPKSAMPFPFKDSIASNRRYDEQPSSDTYTSEFIIFDLLSDRMQATEQTTFRGESFSIKGEMDVSTRLNDECSRLIYGHFGEESGRFLFGKVISNLRDYDASSEEGLKYLSREYADWLRNAGINQEAQNDLQEIKSFGMGKLPHFSVDKRVMNNSELGENWACFEDASGRGLEVYSGTEVFNAAQNFFRASAIDLAMGTLSEGIGSDIESRCDRSNCDHLFSSSFDYLGLTLPEKSSGFAEFYTVLEFLKTAEKGGGAPSKTLQKFRTTDVELLESVLLEYANTTVAPGMREFLIKRYLAERRFVDAFRILEEIESLDFKEAMLSEFVSELVDNGSLTEKLIMRSAVCKVVSANRWPIAINGFGQCEEGIGTDSFWSQ